MLCQGYFVPPWISLIHQIVWILSSLFDQLGSYPLRLQIHRTSVTPLFQEKSFVLKIWHHGRSFFLVMPRWSNKRNFYIINRACCVIEWISFTVSLSERLVNLAECWPYSQHQLPFSGASFATSVQGKLMQMAAHCCYIVLVILGQTSWEFCPCCGYCLVKIQLIKLWWRTIPYTKQVMYFRGRLLQLGSV